MVAANVPRGEEMSGVTLVTGGAGFIGSHLARELLERGNRVRVLDNFDALAHRDGPRVADAEIELVEGDLRDPDRVRFALGGVDAVFHLGGVVGNGESMFEVRRAVDANAGGTATLMEGLAARRDRVRRLVVASSMVVYGEGAYGCAEHGATGVASRDLDRLRRRDWEPRCPRCDRPLSPVPVQEDEPLRPTSVYGITKRDQEELALVVGGAYGIEVVALRYLNVYGPGQALHNPYTGVAALFAARILCGRPPRVFEDGGQLRDPIHVTDAVEATLAAMTARGAPGQAINVGAGGSVTVLELARTLCRLLAPGIQPEVTGEFRAGDIRHCLADVRRARRLLGFAARRSLDEGLEELAEWVRRQTVEERGDEAVTALRTRGLVA